MKVAKFTGKTESETAQIQVVDVRAIKTHPTFVDLLRVPDNLLENMTTDMEAHGFYESQRVVRGIWEG